MDKREEGYITLIAHRDAEIARLKKALAEAKKLLEERCKPTVWNNWVERTEKFLKGGA